MAERKRIIWADAVKGLLIVLVVLGHSIQASMMKLGLNCLDDYLWNLIYSFHMPAFIAVSGFLVYHKNVVGGGRFSWLAFSWRRFRQLIIPYLLWSIVLYFINHNVDYIYDYVLYPQKSLWFLWALFFISIIFNGVEHLASKINIMHEVLMGMCWIILVGIMFAMSDAKLFGVEYVCYYFLYYMIGYYTHKYAKYFLTRNNLLLVVLGLTWFALGSIYSTQGLPKQLQFVPAVSSAILYFSYRICTAIIAVFFLFGIAVKLFNKCNGLVNVMVKLGTVSLGIYAVHMVTRYKLVIVLVTQFPTIGYWKLMLVTFLLLVPSTYMIVWLLNLNKYTARLLLGKI